MMLINHMYAYETCIITYACKYNSSFDVMSITHQSELHFVI